MSIDRIPLPSTDGALWLCGRADIATDPDATLAWADGATTAVCLNPIDELEVRFANYVEWLKQNRGGKALWFPIGNFGAPSLESALPFLRLITARLERGEGVVMHCAAGQGRAGTIAVCVLILLGASKDEALRTVASQRAFAGPGEFSQHALVNGVTNASRD